MNEDFRKRVLLPLLLPLLVLGAILGVAFSLSRVLLAIPEAASVWLALFIALYVLLLAALISARPRISSRALGVGLVAGLAAVVVAGAIGASAGMRELHAEEHAGEAGEEGGQTAAEDEEGSDVPADAQVFVAVDIDYADAPSTATAGTATWALRNDGAILHDVTIDELDIKVEAPGGETVVADVSLEPGSYTYYCSVPGHRAAGMEGTIEVS